MTQPPSGDATGSPSGPPSHDMPASTDPVGPSPADAPADPSAAIPPPATGYPPYQAAGAPKQRRSLMIASIALAAAILLCGGGGTAAFLTLRNAETGEGAKEPTVAVEEFLTAVYKDRDAKKAATRVCSSARNEKKIAAKVAEVEKYASTYQNPRFRWTTPKVDSRNGDRATVTTKVTMTTSDEKVADQDLRFTVVQKTGWWVCEVA